MWTIHGFYCVHPSIVFYSRLLAFIFCQILHEQSHWSVIISSVLRFCHNTVLLILLVFHFICKFLIAESFGALERSVILVPLIVFFCQVEVVQDLIHSLMMCSSFITILCINYSLSVLLLSLMFWQSQHIKHWDVVEMMLETQCFSELLIFKMSRMSLRDTCVWSFLITVVDRVSCKRSISKNLL